MTPLTTDITNIINRFAPAIIGFIVFVILSYNCKDMIVQWFIGLGIKRNQKINELDIFLINGERCLLIKINSFRLYFLAMNDDNSLKKKLITIGNKQFICSGIVKIGKFV